MPPVGDQDQGGQSGALAWIADARSRRRRRATPRNTPPPARKAPAPSETTDSGTDLLDGFDFSQQELGGGADEILDRRASRARPQPEAAIVSPAADLELEAAIQPGPAAGEIIETTVELEHGEDDDVQEQLEHHHERQQPIRTRGAPRGSADLAPATRPAELRPASRLSREGSARARPRRLRGRCWSAARSVSWRSR